MVKLQLNTGDHFTPSDADLSLWVEAYPAVAVERELSAMASWIDANPKRRKTPRGIKRFITSWLERAQNRGGRGLADPDAPIRRTRDMSTLDGITDNFVDDPGVTQYFLEKYGQVFIKGQRIIAGGEK